MILVDAGNRRIKMRVLRKGKRLDACVDSLDAFSGVLADFSVTDTPGADAVYSSVRGSRETRRISRMLDAVAGSVHPVKALARSHVRSLYDSPRIGDDRLALLAYCAIEHRAPVAVIDAGTAITVDFLPRADRHAGGFICSGFESEWNILENATALLPEIRGVRRLLKNKIPTETRDAMVQGVLKTKVFGIRALVEDTIGRFDLPRAAWSVLCTGGDGRLLQRRLSGARYVPDLVLRGLESLERSRRRGIGR
jgi:type III pantothenate kinase